MARYFDPQGRAISLGKELGAGGEGAVFEIEGAPRHVAKIYHRPAPAEKAEKLRAMAELASIDLTVFASWPLEVLHAGRGDQVAGIVLPRIVGHDEIHKLYSPAHRKVAYPDKDWSFLLHTAMNCAAAFDAIHAKSHVIADVNQGNVLVSKRGTVFLIDCDSFQISARGQTYPCEVGVPQFTPPELQGRGFRGLVRTANHDRFGLALLIFHLLVMGRHPYAGRYLGQGDMPIERAIAEFRFTFSRQAAALEMAAPPHTLPLERLAPRLAPLFEQAFSRGSHQHDARPTAGAWHAALAAEIAALKTCDVDRGHKYSGGLANCPWCELMLSGAPNFFLSVTFRGATPAVLDLTPEVHALWAQIIGSPRPQALPLPAFPASRADVTPTPPPPAIESAQSLTNMVGAVAIGGLLAMGLMLEWPLSGYFSVPMFVVFALWWLALVLTSGHRPERKLRRQALRERTAALRQVQVAWQLKVSRAAAQFKLLQKELNAARVGLGKLRAQHDAELGKLGRTLIDRQQTAYLQSKFIADHKIDGVTVGRQAILASYGIETAHDVEYNRVLGIPCMDPQVTNMICAWRSEMLRQFKPDRAQGVPAAERQALLLKYAQQRQRLLVGLKQGPAKLRALHDGLKRDLAALARQHDEATLAVVQAQADLEVMEAIAPTGLAGLLRRMKGPEERHR